MRPASIAPSWLLIAISTNIEDKTARWQTWIKGGPSFLTSLYFFY